MRKPLIFLLLLFVVAGTACERADNTAPGSHPIVGTWKLMGMTKEPFPIERITESDVIGGHMTFKEDGTFEGEVLYPKMPDKNLKVSGTYSVENQTLTVNNQSNNSTSKSTLKFEQDFMITSPKQPGAVIMYYKRVR